MQFSHNLDPMMLPNGIMLDSIYSRRIAQQFKVNETQS